MVKTAGLRWHPGSATFRPPLKGLFLVCSTEQAGGGAGLLQDRPWGALQGAGTHSTEDAGGSGWGPSPPPPGHLCVRRAPGSALIQGWNLPTTQSLGRARRPAPRDRHLPAQHCHLRPRRGPLRASFQCCWPAWLGDRDNLCA